MSSAPRRVRVVGAWLAGCSTRRWLVALAIATSVNPVARAQDSAAIVFTLFARAMQPGEVIRLDLRCACGEAVPTASAFGREVPLFRTGEGRWRGLIGIDLETQPGAHEIVVTGDGTGAAARTSARTLNVLAKRFPTRRLRVAGRFVEPPAAERPRIEREAVLLQDLFAAASPRLWDSPFRPPVAQAPVSNFGARSVFNGQARNPHGGVDFASPAGTPIAAPAAGRIALAQSLYFTGTTVIIDHGQGIYSLLAHLSRLDVAAGDTVARGAIVGLVGATGRVTGPHLHWTVRLHGARVDPLSLVNAMAQ